jgi:hypothetical protein
MEITPEISVEDLVRLYPQSVYWLRERGIVCVICGEAVWGTLFQLVSDNGYNKQEALQLIEEMQSEL